MKLNSDKTKLLLMGTPTNLNKMYAFNITISNHCITPAKQLNMQAHIREISRNDFYNSHYISKIKYYLNYSVTEEVIKMRVDYCNALLVGLPKSPRAPLQQVQNCAARILTRTKKYDHRITPKLMKMHWLPVKYIIMYK